ncbi:MAG: hypothetical protein IGS03_14175 [Candidatus Sericytochromatia bacterium]|nr:hypothetical protein [Candidatus Sericytochromatia bacterium]
MLIPDVILPLILSIFLLALAGLGFILYRQHQRIQQLLTQQQPVSKNTLSPEEARVKNIRSEAELPSVHAKRPKSLAITSVSGGSAKSTLSFELSQHLQSMGERVLLVDLSEHQSLCLLLGLVNPAPGQLHHCADDNLAYVTSPRSDPDTLLGIIQQCQKNFNPDWVLLNLPALRYPSARNCLPLADAMLLNLRLDPACLDDLARSVHFISSMPKRPSLLGVLAVRFESQSALQQSLLKTLQRDYPALLLPEIFHENAALQLAQMHGQTCNEPDYRRTCQRIIQAVQERVKQGVLI